MAKIEKRQRSDGGAVRYRARVFAPTGERSKTFNKRSEAAAWAAAEEHKINQGAWVDPRAGRRTFGEYALAWQQVQAQHRSTTAARVTSTLRNHILPFFEDQQIGSVRPTAIKAWVKHRSEHMAPASLEVAYGYLGAIFRAAVEDRVISESPCPPPKRVLPRKPKTEVQPPSTAEVEANMVALPERYRAIAIVAAGGGLRSGEILGLTKPKIDFLRSRSVLIDQQLVLPDRGATYLGQLKSDASYRTVPLSNSVLGALAAHMQSFPPTPITVRDASRGREDERAHEFLFTTDRGAMVRRNRFNEIWRAAVARAVVDKDGEKVPVSPGIGLHDLRHYYASLLIRKGCSVKTVQKRLGHASAVETLDTYAHLWDDDEEQTRDAVDDVLVGMLSGLATTGESEATAR